MAERRTVLIGTGVLLPIVGFFVSTPVCGVSIRFTILGRIMWPRNSDE